MPLVYKRGSVFDDNEATTFCHACNCQHVWGAGVAAKFKQRFPWAYEQEGELTLIPGTSNLYTQDGYPDVLCLYTSWKYGVDKDPESLIVNTTLRALTNSMHYFYPGDVIASPKINAGLFGVPWSRTAKLIEAFCEATGVVWNVWEMVP